MVLVIFLMLLSPGLGQVTGTSGRVNDPSVRETLRVLVDSALTAPPEIAADLLIRNSGISGARVTDRLDWFDRAFRLAGSATFKLRLVPAYGGSTLADSNVGTTGMALAVGLDTLSLQSRAITSMLALDRAKAMDLFRSLPQPRVPKVVCAEDTGSAGSKSGVT